MTKNKLEPFYFATEPADPESILGVDPGPGKRYEAVYRAAYKLYWQQYDVDQALALIEEWLGYSDAVMRREVRDAYQKQDDSDGIIVGGRSKYIETDVPRIVSFLGQYGRYGDFLDYCQTTDLLRATLSWEWIEALYHPHDFLYLGISVYDTNVGAASDWIALLKENFRNLASRCAHLGPNPYRSDQCTRSDQGILERRYYTIEFDISGVEMKKDGTIHINTRWAPILEDYGCSGWDLQAAVIRHLLDVKYPIVGIVHSGNKSLHTYCSARGLSEDEIIKQLNYAIALGADSHGKNLSQAWRLPNPIHYSRKQHLVYFNPDHINK